MTLASPAIWAWWRQATAWEGRRLKSAPRRDRRRSGKACRGGRAGREGSEGGQGGWAATEGGPSWPDRRAAMHKRAMRDARCTSCDMRCVTCDAAHARIAGRGRCRCTWSASMQEARRCEALQSAQLGSWCTSHHDTCYKLPQGRPGCRMAKPGGHVSGELAAHAHTSLAAHGLTACHNVSLHAGGAHLLWPQHTDDGDERAEDRPSAPLAR